MISTALLLAAAALSQLPAVDPADPDPASTAAPTPTFTPRPSDALVVSLSFTAAQEEWCQAADRSDDARRHLSHLPPAQRTLVLSLGSRRYADREHGEWWLERQGEQAAQALLWGRKHPDRAIRDTCDRLWQRLFMCRACRGYGEVIVKSEYAGMDREVKCEPCDGAGDWRYERRWTDEGYRYVERPMMVGKSQQERAKRSSVPPAVWRDGVQTP